jgi:hypothetical protein
VNPGQLCVITDKYVAIMIVFGVVLEQSGRMILQVDFSKFKDEVSKFEDEGVMV